MKEIFKDVPGYNGRYQVSNKGRVRNTETKLFLTTNQCSRSSDKYYVGLSKNGRSKNYSVARLVLLAFRPPATKGRWSVQLNGDATDFRPDNIESMTKSQGMRYVMHSRGRTKNAGKERGVYFYSRNKNKSWRAVIKVGKKVKTIGYYETKDEASKVFQAKFEQLHGYKPWKSE